MFMRNSVSTTARFSCLLLLILLWSSPQASGQGLPWSAAATAAGDGYLPSPDPLTDGNAGATMEISSHIAVVGAFPSSQIFLLEKDPSTQLWQGAQIGDQATGIVGQIVGEDWFGYSISVDDETLAVSAPLHGTSGNAIGIVFIFRKDPLTGSWQQQAVLENPIPQPLDWFGLSVSLEGDVLAIGAPGDRDAQGVDGGGVFIYQREISGGDWILVDVLWNPSPSNASGDAFGESVILAGGRLAVGAPGTEGSSGEASAGCGYIFERSVTSGEFELIQVILNPDPAPGETMGRSMAFTETHLACGIPDDESAGVANGGSVYLYRREADTGVWVPASTDPAAAIPGHIPAADPQDLSNFGISVALSGNVLAVGAARDAVTGVPEAGSCSIYERDAIANQWTLRQQIDNPEPDQGDLFGFAIALDQHQLAVGVKMESINGLAGAGAAYLYERSGSFIRPDCNTDGSFNIADAINVLSYLFTGATTPDCRDACDANDDGALNLADAVMMLNDLFVPGSVSIPLPNPGCSIDPTEDSLDCSDYSCP